ncbi:MAG TPA: YmdB family metallophosphoesterase, partial [Candidatus Fermentibacter sp.]|nr:YmdB family metallophosphoesterase [Candidatus Fermentibacter sp.]
MKVLLLGDVVGSPGRRCAVRYIRENPHDIVVVNGENASGGIGITPGVAGQLLDAGVTVITTG